MKTLELNIPDNLDLELIPTSRFLAAKLYEAGIITLGQGAEISGLTKSAFSEILGDYKVSLFQYSAEEALEDARKI